MKPAFDLDNLLCGKHVAGVYECGEAEFVYDK